MVTTKVIFVIIFGIILLVFLVLFILKFGKIYESEELGIQALFQKLIDAIENLVNTFLPS
ncbi:MAG: hypothetical protein QW140_00400 [Candidatus Aenigmatarchaeota archaeon]